MTNRAKHGVRWTAVVLVACAMAWETRAAYWSWELPLDRYQRMNAFERAQYDKAARMVKEQNYRGAASEFEKFKVQFQDSENLPQMLFLFGYSLHLDKQRNKAIEVYNEVLDYFGDVIPAAAPALYFMGMAHLENGDVREGMVFLKEMADDEDYQKHPLAAGAINQLAENEWKNKNIETAVAYWKQVVRDFAGANDKEAGIAREQVTAHYIKTGDYRAYEAWLISDENAEDVKHRKWVVQNAWALGFDKFRYDWGEYTDFTREEKLKDMRALYEYVKAQPAWYEKDDDLWGYYHNLLLFAAQRLRDREETKALMPKVVPLVNALKEETERNNRFAWMADRLREADDHVQAIFCVNQMTDPPHASYKEYEILYHQQKWQAAVAKLEQIEGMGDAEWAKRALRERARVHKDVLRDYEKAIALYRAINDPPGTLWAIQECYRQWGKLDDALATLSEIENMFPADAPNAAWHKAKYLEESGQSKKALAQALRILKVYPESPASSLAHQLREKHGMATGGGVFEGE